uniref:Uncharacterized protein n=1 Tax=Leersia perrieri TaxID=77586 RepID=A0A0D9V074_9ORYZ
MLVVGDCVVEQAVGSRRQRRRLRCSSAAKQRRCCQDFHLSGRPIPMTVAHPVVNHHKTGVVASDELITSPKTTAYEINVSDAQNELALADYTESRFYKSTEEYRLTTLQNY